MKVMEKELEQLKLVNKDLSRQAKDKSVAIEKEKHWHATVSRLQPKCEILEEENEKLRVSFYKRFFLVKFFFVELRLTRSGRYISIP